MGITDEKISKILDGRDINALLGLINDPQISKDEQPRIVLRALSQLEALSYDGLPELVIKVCVEAPEKTAWDVRHFFLSPWLRGEGYHYRSQIIADITARLQNTTGNQLVATIQTAWVIGYRDDRLQAELARIAGLQSEPHPDDNAQGYALSVLSDMAYPNSEQIAQALQARLHRIGHLTEPDCWTARYVASPGMIPALCEAANSKPPEQIAVSALLMMPMRYPDKASEVWRAFESLDDKIRFIYLNTATDQIDLKEVGHHVLSEVLTTFQHIENRNTLPPMNQLLKANLPSHIHIFRVAKNSLNSEEREWLKIPAVEPTGSTGQFNTLETLNKDAAWKVILRLGLDEARIWLPESMAGEIGFPLTKLGEIAGFLQVAEAVKPLAAAVTNKATKLGVGISCLRCLGVIGTPEALNAILESQVRIEHDGERLIPLDLVEALGTACIALRSYETVWNVLRDSDADKQIREACAHTIYDLSTYIGAPLPSAQELTRLLRDEGATLPGYEQLVLTLWRFSDNVEVLGFLRELASSEYNQPELTQALALTGLLNEFPARIEGLGIKRVDERWIAPEKLDFTVALALLCLYRLDQSFETAIVQVFEGGSVYPPLHLIANLRSTDHLSISVRQALWNYVLDENGPIASNRAALEAVARTRPDKLMEDSTIVEVSQWSSSARRAYLAALRTILVERCNTSIIAQIACQFLVDSESDVRRDAARLARDSDPAALRQAVEQFVGRAEELDQAVFMLNAAFWLEDDWSLYESLGHSHREPLVRELTRTLSHERKEAKLAREYLPFVLESHDYLDTWCYGQAVLELGNEETVDALYAGLPSEVYRRSYLIWLAKELEKRLEKQRKDQSEKTELPPPISKEQPVEVTIEFEGERLGPFAGVLQENLTRRPRRWLSGWSIRIDNEPDLALRLNSGNADDSIYLEITDGRRGQVLPVRTQFNLKGDRTANRILLLGQGDLE
ncbi:MAG: hypothetical protein ACLGJB_03605 [Blastocatellia bacterium]